MKCLSLVFCFCFFLTSYSQNKISGRVVSETGKPLAGANVFISNTLTGIHTDANGEFVLNNVPARSFKLAVSFVDYEVLTMMIPENDRNVPFLFKLTPKAKELESVIVSQYKEGWSKWGATFIEAFIGKSAFAENCNIKNKEAIRFLYNKDQRKLLANAYSPLVIENNVLGFRVTVNLIDFAYDLATEQVDYQMYSFFEPLQGSEEQVVTWKANREEAYSYSLMHFMRSLFKDNLKKEGFEVRMMESGVNTEKIRIQALFNKEFQMLRDSLSGQELREKSLAKLVEKRFARDSLKYYRKVLDEDDRIQKVHEKILPYEKFAKKMDSTVQLNFANYLVVVYNRKKEPIEYYNYRKRNAPVENTPEMGATVDKKEAPLTVLYLAQGIPIEIYENGYFNNVDLVLDGFWGWWEKLATKLPYDYAPN